MSALFQMIAPLVYEVVPNASARDPGVYLRIGRNVIGFTVWNFPVAARIFCDSDGKHRERRRKCQREVHGWPPNLLTYIFMFLGYPSDGRVPCGRREQQRVSHVSASADLYRTSRRLTPHNYG